MEKKFIMLSIILIQLLFMPMYTLGQTISKHRLIVLSDIEADPDDSQSLIRLLLYSNQIDIEGLIAITSIHQKTRVAPETMRKIITAYGKVQPNLLKHESGFPSEQYLLALVKQGLPVFGMEGVGKLSLIHI